MSVQGLLKELPGINMEDYRVKFSTLDVLCGDTYRPTNIEISTLVFVYILWHGEVYNIGD